MTEHAAGNVPMRLQVLLPQEVLVNTDSIKVIAEADNGFFCLLPRHIDFVSALVPGVLIFEDPDGRERFVAVDEGLLVKCGREVIVSTLDGICGDELEALEALVQERFRTIDEHERKARTALARLEAGTLRRFVELEEVRRG